MCLQNLDGSILSKFIQLPFAWSGVNLYVYQGIHLLGILYSAALPLSLLRIYERVSSALRTD